MLRLIWLALVGSWKFPWEKEPPAPVRALSGRRTLQEYDWDGEREACGHLSRIDNADYPRECNGAPSEWCSAGRCRVHCRDTCKCETTRPDAPILEELPRETPSTGAPYR